METVLDSLIDSYKEEMLQSVQELIRIPSVIDADTGREGAPFGENIQTALKTVLQLSADMGFETREYDGYAGSVRYGKHYDRDRAGRLSACIDYYRSRPCFCSRR